MLDIGMVFKALGTLEELGFLDVTDEADVVDVVVFLRLLAPEFRKVFDDYTKKDLEADDVNQVEHEEVEHVPHVEVMIVLVVVALSDQHVPHRTRRTRSE